LGGKVQEESETVVVRSQCLFALALLVFALKKLKFSEPLIHGVRDLRPTGFVLALNDRDIGIQSFERCLLALLGINCGIEVVANRSQGRVPSAREYRRK
jgi:hypothetical protein